MSIFENTIAISRIGRMTLFTNNPGEPRAHWRGARRGRIDISQEGGIKLNNNHYSQIVCATHQPNRGPGRYSVKNIPNDPNGYRTYQPVEVVDRSTGATYESGIKISK
ncbi:MAG TPA: hypothetical protein PKG71_04260 [Candidatus Woesebacteria bacterium]|nr:hypothetical protein [Candidatus Woesebacteria bacterium]HNS95153.1 hypothetical protein [Candidatus Woesebacteria bacterium]